MGANEEADVTPATLDISRRPSQGSSSSRSRKPSRIESVKVGSTIVLIELEEHSEDEELDTATRKSSIDAPNSAVSVAAIEHEIEEDKLINREIKKQIGHHSPETETANAVCNNVIPEENESYRSRIKKWRVCTDGAFVRLFFYLCHHLHLAFATPALIRIPHLAHKYASKNGSAFVLVYFLCLILVGLPVCVLETTMAQYSSLGPINIFGGCLPLIKGLGYGMVLTCAILMLLASTLLSWSCFYLFHSANSVLPWSHCPTNHTNGCKEIQVTISAEERENSTDFDKYTFIKVPYIPSDYFFQMNVTKSLEVEPDDSLQETFTLVAILMGLWPLILFFVSRHYVWRPKLLTSCFALVTLGTFITLVFNGLVLENSGGGLNQVFHLDTEEFLVELNNPDLWLDCLGQVFWSLGPCIGFLLSRTSYNNFRQRIVREVSVAIFFNLFVQYLVMFAVFSYAGHLYEENIYKNLGYFYVIISYAATETILPSVCSFVLFLCISENLFSHIVMLADTVVISLTDSLSIEWRRSGLKRFSVEFLVCLFGFFGSLLFVTKEGIYYLSTTDRLVPWIAGISLGFMEIFALVYIYKTKNIKLHFQKMQNSKTLLVCLCKYFVAPVFLAMLIWTMVVGIGDPLPWDHTETARKDTYFKVGVGFALLPIVISFVTLCVELIRNRKDLKCLLKPSSDWGSALSRHTELLKTRKRRDRTKPWLVIQGSATAIVPENLTSWIPYGYSWVPENWNSRILKEGHSDISYATRKGLAALLVEHFSKIGEKRLFSQVDYDNVSDTIHSHSRNPSDFKAESPTRSRVRKSVIIENDYLNQCSSPTRWNLNNYFLYNNHLAIPEPEKKNE